MAESWTKESQVNQAQLDRNIEEYGQKVSSLKLVVLQLEEQKKDIREFLDGVLADKKKEIDDKQIYLDSLIATNEDLRSKLLADKEVLEQGLSKLEQDKSIHSNNVFIHKQSLLNFEETMKNHDESLKQRESNINLKDNSLKDKESSLLISSQAIDNTENILKEKQKTIEARENELSQYIDSAKHKDEQLNALLLSNNEIKLTYERAISDYQKLKDELKLSMDLCTAKVADYDNKLKELDDKAVSIKLQQIELDKKIELSKKIASDTEDKINNLNILKSSIKK